MPVCTCLSKPVPECVPGIDTTISFISELPVIRFTHRSKEHSWPIQNLSFHPFFQLYFFADVIQCGSGLKFFFESLDICCCRGIFCLLSRTVSDTQCCSLSTVMSSFVAKDTQNHILRQILQSVSNEIDNIMGK